MNQKHVPSIELCQQFVDLCSKNNITIPETEYQWQIGGKLSGETTATLVPTNRPPTYGSADSAWRFIPAPLVSEQGEWLGKVSGKDFLNSYLEVMDLFIFQIDKVQMSHNLMTDPDIGISMINYLLAEGIITKL